MKPARLWEIAVTVAPEAEDATVALLEKIFETTPSAYSDLELGTTRVSVFLPARAAWNQASEKALATGLARMRGCGLAVGPGEISFKSIRPQDWAESWKRHFKPISIGSKLLIKPSWSRRRPRAGQALVVLDPGLSFGTGQHPTTLFCLQQLARRRRPGTRQSFLDAGTGSGILAIAAAKLGYQSVQAFDFDPEAVLVARTNAASNSVAKMISINRRELTRLPVKTKAQFDVICANLIFDLLISESSKLINRLKPDGTLVLAGILATQFERVRAHFEAAGLQLMSQRTQKEWRSGAFRIARHGDVRK
ncbi:MAG: 50S ribosomal protein L11 methyltransferase [Verrucomicrobia bacterium]|nr:50S ribosomal protein L11 methyltransferase [Verrucomicrobiota bacterium]